MQLKALFVPLALALAVLPAAAQRPSSQVPLAPGTRVRVKTPTLVAPLVANFLEQRGDTLVFIEDGTGRGVWRFALDQVERLEVTAGEAGGNRGKMLRGGAIGAGAGLVAGYVFAAWASPSDTTREYDRVLTSAVGGAVGAGIGVLVGSRIKSERWAAVPLPRQFAIVPDGRGGVRIAIRLR
ncbi:MAG: hypothetical protein HUU26_12380 [Gemmatimonadaceae bacterium]|nr:hypothetical protein [Gemmatimonadaceae bacterium]